MSEFQPVAGPLPDCRVVAGEYVKLAILWLAACIDKTAFRQNMRAIACKATHEGALVRGHRKHARDAALQVLGLGIGASVEPVVSMNYVDAVWAAAELASGGRIACPPTPATEVAGQRDGKRRPAVLGSAIKYDEVDCASAPFFIAVDYEGIGAMGSASTQP